LRFRAAGTNLIPASQRPSQLPGETPMKIRLFTAAIVVLALVGLATAQEMPKPGPEHEKFKDMVGEWDCTVKMAGMEVQAKATYKLDFGGFYLIEQFTGDFGGMKFKGRGQTGYCPIRKKYVTLWIDSMSPSPLILSGNYDKEGKTLTEEGEGPNQEGKMAKFKNVGTMTDKDTFAFTMYEVKDGKDVETMSITYKRKK
jgi:hypothetical protein